MAVCLVRTLKGKLLYSGMKVSPFVYHSVRKLSCCTHNCTREIWCFYDYDTNIMTFKHSRKKHPCATVFNHQRMLTAISIIVHNLSFFRVISKRCHKCKCAVKSKVLFTFPKAIITKSHICFYEDDVDYFIAISITKRTTCGPIPSVLYTSKKKELRITLSDLLKKLSSTTKKAFEFDFPGCVSYVASCVRHADPVFYPVCFTKNMCYQCGVDFNTEVFTKSNATILPRITKDQMESKHKRTEKNQLYSSACVWSKNDTLYVSTANLPDISDLKPIFGNIKEKRVIFNVRTTNYAPNRMVAIKPCVDKRCKECTQIEKDRTPVCCVCLTPGTEIGINIDTQMCQQCVNEVDPKYNVTELDRAILKQGMLKSGDDYTDCTVCKITCETQDCIAHLNFIVVCRWCVKKCNECDALLLVPNPVNMCGKCVYKRQRANKMTKEDYTRQYRKTTTKLH